MTPLTKLLNPENFVVDRGHSTYDRGLLLEIRDCLERSVQSPHGRRLLQRLVGEPYTVKADWRFRVRQVAVDGDDHKLFTIYALDGDDYPMYEICPNASRPVSRLFNEEN